MPEVNKEDTSTSPATAPGTSRRTTADVRRWYDDGIPMADAFRIALGGSVREFVLRQSPPLRTTPQNAATMIRGGRPATDELVDAMARELEATPVEIRELIWLGAKPKELAAAS